jgi:hypothetical protein
LVGTAMAVTVGIALVSGCGTSNPATGSGATVVDEPTTTTSPADDEDTEEEPAETPEESPASPADSELGTRDNPLPIGTTIEMGDWTLTVTDVSTDATDEIMSENEFNEPPAEGRQFLMFGVEATYNGDDSGTAWLDFSWAIVGSGGNTFGDTGDFEDYCGVIPDDLNEAGEAFPGANVAGNVCFSVPSDQVEGSTIRIEELMSFEDTRAFYATS